MGFVAGLVATSTMLAAGLEPAGAATPGQGVGWGIAGGNLLGFTPPNDAAHKCGPSLVTCSMVPGVVGGSVGQLQSVAAGGGPDRFSIGVDSSGGAWSWGGGCDGEMGRGGTGGCSEPSAMDHVLGVGGVGTLSGVSAVAAGGQHALALLSNGKVLSWGQNEHGQLGDGTDAEDTFCRCRTTPVPVVGPGGTGLLGDGTATPRITAISAGRIHSMALDNTGHVWTWGADPNGELGDGPISNHANACLVRSGSRTLFCSMVPVEVTGVGGTGLLTATAISAGYASSYALTSGNVAAWGENGAGQLGNGTTTGSPSPVKVLQGTSNLGGITAIAAGGDFGLAVKGTGSTASVWAWGNNSNGQLGNNTKTAKSTAGQVHGLANAGFLTGIRSVSASLARLDQGSAAYAVTNGGGVWAWGTNGFGELGSNSTTPSLTPVKVKGVGGNVSLGGSLQMAAGLNYALAYGIPADVTLAGSAPGSVARTTNIVYTLSVTGHGPNTPATVTVAGKTPANSTFQDATTNAGTTCTKPAKGTTGININCPLGATIASGVTKTVTITLKATGTIGTHVIFKPTISGNFQDASSSDNLLTLDTTIS